MKEQRAIFLKNPPLDSILILMDHETEIAIQARQIVLQLVGLMVRRKAAPMEGFKPTA